MKAALGLDTQSGVQAVQVCLPAGESQGPGAIEPRR